MNGLEFKVQHNVVTSVASPKLSIATFPWMISYFAIHPFLCVWNLCFLLLLPTPRLRFSKIRCFLLTLIVLLCVVPSNILIILILLQLWAEKKGLLNSSDSEMPTEAEGSSHPGRTPDRATMRALKKNGGFLARCLGWVQGLSRNPIHHDLSLTIIQYHWWIHPMTILTHCFPTSFIFIPSPTKYPRKNTFMPLRKKDPCRKFNAGESFQPLEKLGGGNSNIFLFSPLFGKIPILTNFFEGVGSAPN